MPAVGGRRSPDAIVQRAASGIPLLRSGPALTFRAFAAGPGHAESPNAAASRAPPESNDEAAT